MLTSGSRMRSPRTNNLDPRFLGRPFIGAPFLFIYIVIEPTQSHEKQGIEPSQDVTQRHPLL